MNYKKCKRCGKLQNSNTPYCSKCTDILLYGSQKNAREAFKKNHEYYFGKK